VVRPEGEVAVYCLNPACPAQLVERIIHFVYAMDVEGMGARTVQLLVDEGLVHDAADLFALQREDVLRLDGFAEKSTQNLLAAISAAKDRPLARLLTALGIRGVGWTVANALARRFGSLDGLQGATQQSLEDIEGMGPHTATSILDWFMRQPNLRLLQRLREAGVRTADDQPGTSRHLPLEGVTFAITGTLPAMSRERAKAVIENHGGRVTGSVSSRTSFLLVGDRPGSGKTRAAVKHNVPVIQEADLMQMVGKETGPADEG
jgi:DNA ligase (NAD+)